MNNGAGVDKKTYLFVYRLAKNFVLLQNEGSNSGGSSIYPDNKMFFYFMDILRGKSGHSLS
jgi:hypothetical protein